MDQQEFKAQVEKLKTQQDLNRGILFGVVGALVAAATWGAITYLTGHQYGFAAILVGLLVGFAVRFGGKGVEPKFGYIGGGLAILGCLLGNYFGAVAYTSNTVGIGFWDVLAEIGISGIIPAIQEIFSMMDLIFFAIAAYAGYKYSWSNEDELYLNS